MVRESEGARGAPARRNGPMSEGNAVGPLPGRAWLDPRGLLQAEERRLVDSDRGLSALFDLLARDGPAHVPAQSRAARTAFMSSSTLQRRIRRLTCLSWTSFVVKWRLRTALWMLRHTDSPERWIARRCGFATHRGLCRAFQREYWRS